MHLSMLHITNYILCVVIMQFPFFTLIAFDSHQMGLPVAWSIQQKETTQMIVNFLQKIKDAALKLKPDWKPSCFIFDCAPQEVAALKAVFPGFSVHFIFEGTFEILSIYSSDLCTDYV